MSDLSVNILLDASISFNIRLIESPDTICLIFSKPLFTVDTTSVDSVLNFPNAEFNVLYNLTPWSSKDLIRSSILEFNLLVITLVSSDCVSILAFSEASIESINILISFFTTFVTLFNDLLLLSIRPVTLLNEEDIVVIESALAFVSLPFLSIKSLNILSSYVPDDDKGLIVSIRF